MVVRDGLAEHLQEYYGLRSALSMHGLHCSFAYSALASDSMQSKTLAKAMRKYRARRHVKLPTKARLVDAPEKL